jgi:hypothetical protein
MDDKGKMSNSRAVDAIKCRNKREMENNVGLKMEKRNHPPNLS